MEAILTKQENRSIKLVNTFTIQSVEMFFTDFLYLETVLLRKIVSSMPFIEKKLFV